MKKKSYQAACNECGVEEIYEFITTKPEEFQVGAKATQLKVAEVSKIRAVQQWYFAQEEKNLQTWHKLTEEVLIEFIQNGGSDKSQDSQARPPSTIVVNPTSSGPADNSGMLQGVKRSIGEYPKLREDKMWLSWNRALKALAATHAVSEVLNPTYVPQTEAAKKDFKSKNTFMYSVFTATLLSSKAKNHLKAFEDTQDAQMVYLHLVESYQEGTAANLTSEALENQIRNMKLDQSWNKPIENFLHTWSSRIHDLETVRDEEVALKDKKRWMVSSIKSHAELYQSVTTAMSVEETMKSIRGGHELTWDSYDRLLLNHAQILDSNKSAAKRVQKVNSQSQNRNNNRNGKQKNRQNGDGYIPQEKWNAMSSEERKKVYEQRKQRNQKNRSNRVQQNNQSSVQQSNQNQTATTVKSQTQSDSNPPTVVVANQSVAPSEISVNTTAQSQAQRFLVNYLKERETF